MGAQPKQPARSPLRPALIALLLSVAAFGALYFFLFYYRYIPCEYCKGHWDPVAYSQKHGVPLPQVRKTCPACDSTGKITYLEWFLD